VFAAQHKCKGGNKVIGTGRLNGWHRIWVVLTTIYAVVVAPIAVSLAPTRQEIVSAWSRDVLRALENDVKRTSGREISAAQFRSAKDLFDKTDEQVARDLTYNAKEIDLGKPEQKELSQYKAEVLMLEAKYETQLESLLRLQLTHWAYAIFAWLGPSLALLLLGYAFAWIARGFRHK
jgi:hypothetical protein